MLRNGATISDTIVRPDLEDLVKSGSAALAPVAAGEVATLVDEGAKGFGSSGQDIRSLLGNLRDIVHAYAGRTGDIEAVVSSLNQLNTTLAKHAPQQGMSLVNTHRALSSLREQMPALKAAIVQLDRLAVGGRSVLQAHSDEMSRFFTQVREILTVLRNQQADIAGILKYAPLHDRNTQLVEYSEFNQVLQDFVICGFNDDPSDPARRCNGDDGGTDDHQARRRQPRRVPRALRAARLVRRVAAAAREGRGQDDPRRVLGRLRARSPQRRDDARRPGGLGQDRDALAAGRRRHRDRPPPGVEVPSGTRPRSRRRSPIGDLTLDLHPGKGADMQTAPRSHVGDDHAARPGAHDRSSPWSSGSVPSSDLSR
jgi:hypothetical protein